MTPRIPEYCPYGYERYIVKPGEAFYKIIQRFGMDLNHFIWQNTHIPNPNLIYPGDVVCVPKRTLTPKIYRHAFLKPVIPLPIWANGFAYVSDSPVVTGTYKSITVVANLPSPAALSAEHGINIAAYALSVNVDYPMVSTTGYSQLLLTPDPENYGYPYTTRLDIYDISEIISRKATLKITIIGVRNPQHIFYGDIKFLEATLS